MLYLAMALFWLYMAYTELSGKDEITEDEQEPAIEPALAESER